MVSQQVQTDDGSNSIHLHNAELPSLNVDPLDRYTSFHPIPPDNSMPLVPHVRQPTEYSCGYGATASVLLSFGKKYESESQLISDLKCVPEFGTDRHDIMNVGRTYGLHVEGYEHLSLESIAQHLEDGHRIIICYQAWPSPGETAPWSLMWKQGHYAVIVGVDAEKVYLVDPAEPGGGGFGYIPRNEFLERWHDEDRYGQRLERYGIVFSDPSLAPASALRAA